MSNKIFYGYDNIFAKRLRELMADTNTTQVELANEMGVTRQAVSQYMDGSAQPNIDKFYRIAKYFNVSADYLLGFSNTTTTDTKIKSVCEYTGLNENTIKAFVFMKNYDDSLSNIFDLLINEAGLLATKMLEIKVFCEDVKAKNKCIFDEIKRISCEESLNIKDEDIIKHGYEILPENIFFEKVLLKENKTQEYVDIDYQLYKIKNQFGKIIQRMTKK